MDMLSIAARSCVAKKVAARLVPRREEPDFDEKIDAINAFQLPIDRNELAMHFADPISELSDEKQIKAYDCPAGGFCDLDVGSQEWKNKIWTIDNPDDVDPLPILKGGFGDEIDRGDMVVPKLDIESLRKHGN